MSSDAAQTSSDRRALGRPLRQRYVKSTWGHEYCEAHENWKLHAKVFVRDTHELINEIYPDKLGCNTEWMHLREYYDPISGVLLQAKEQLLHCDIRAGDRVFYFSTLTWMVWNWHVAVLQSGATIMLFDGSPFHPGPAALWDYAADEGFTLFGTSARYLDTVRKSGLRPGDGRDLSALRMVSSTGSPLAPVNYAFVYEAVKRDVHLAPVSGGTDIVGCFVTGDPTRPVRDGEIQRPSLAMDISVVDEAAHPVPPGVKGELVCATPFPSIPLGFLGDVDGSPSAPPISTAFRACGTMATSLRSPRRAASSSTAARTRP